MKKEDIKVSIGLPTFNNEKTIARTIESLINQRYKNFELIISDDASEDKTFDICSTYQKQDVRIKCFRQERNLGFWKNWFFVLEKAKGKYFMWAEGDDIWLESFIEKNFQFLENNSKYVGSIGKIKFFDEKGKEILNKISPDFVKNFTNYDLQTKINYYLRNMKTADLLFALYKTSELKKCIMKNPSLETERCILLKIMKFGDVNALDEILLHRYMVGMTVKKTPLERIKLLNSRGLLGLMFPYLPFTFWFSKNFGFKIFLKNLDYFIILNLHYLGFVDWNFIRIKIIKNWKNLF